MYARTGPVKREPVIRGVGQWVFFSQLRSRCTRSKAVHRRRALSHLPSPSSRKRKKKNPQAGQPLRHCRNTHILQHFPAIPTPTLVSNWTTQPTNEPDIKNAATSIKQSALIITNMAKVLKWAQNTTQGKLSISKNNNNGTSGEKKWIHPPEALQKGHIAYLVKFLGNTVVDQPKGIEVVKEGIRKLQFSQQLKKSESGGAKMKKLELTISVDGVAIQEPKTHTILHQFPLHRISYCADDKGEKKYFSFIAKQANQDNEADDKHECFVFISDKLAEEITLTIGQAFELAYKRFLETSGKDLESHRRAVLTQQKIKRLEYENNVYKQRLLDMSKFASCRADLDAYMRKHEIKNILEVVLPISVSGSSEQQNGQSDHHSPTIETSNQLLDLDTELNGTNGNAPPVPPRNFDNQPVVGTKLQNLLLNDLEDDDDDFDPRSFENSHNVIMTNGNGIINMNPTTPSSPPLLAPPPKAMKRSNINNNDSPVRTFGQELFAASANNSFAQANSAKTPDPFEMGDFNAPISPSSQFESDIGMLDKRIMEMKTGFSRGISFGNEDFSLESLDPLRN